MNVGAAQHNQLLASFDCGELAVWHLHAMDWCFGAANAGLLMTEVTEADLVWLIACPLAEAAKSSHVPEMLMKGRYSLMNWTTEE